MVKKIGIYREPRNKGRPWTVRWYGEYNPTAGTQRRYTKSFRTKRQAEEYRAQVEIDFRQGAQRDRAEQVFLGEFCRDYLKIRSPEIRPSTRRIYENTIYRLVGHFGSDCPLSNITPHMAVTFLAELKRLDGRDGNLSKSQIRKKLLNCKTMFGAAVSWGLIPTNPFKTQKPPKCVPRAWHYLKPPEYKALLEAAPSLVWRALYALAYTGGLRLGELVNLVWAELDFEKGYVAIRNHKGTDRMPPFYVKDYEERTIPLPADTLQILQRLRQDNPTVFKVPYIVMTERRFENIVAKWQLFREQRRPWTNKDMSNNVLTNFKRHVRKAGIEPNGQLAIHTLRKSCIQTWADHLPPNVTKELAGHSSLETTMAYYSQVDDYHRVKAAQIMDAWLHGKKKASRTGLT
jgi:integrase